MPNFMKNFFNLPLKNKYSVFWIVGGSIAGPASYCYYKKSLVELEKETVLIVGAGVGGYNVARSLGNHSSFKVIVIEPNNVFTYPPLLPQVAAGILTAHQITFPYTSLFGNYSNIRVVHACASNINLSGNKVTLDNGETVAWDKLVVATGSRPNYFGHPEFEAATVGLKTIKDATEICAATRGAQKKRIGIIGAGPTGVTLAALLRRTGSKVEL